MFKNVATKIALFAFDTTTGAAKTGDSANITAYVSKDYGAATQLTDTTATEMDATNAKGWYLFDVAQAESNADALLFTGKSSTANISVVGQYIHTTPNRFTTLVIDSSGLADANAVKVGPSGSGTAQTAKDLGASVTQTGDSYSRLGAPAGASISADIAAVPTATENADALLNRDMSAVSDTNSRSPLNALRAIRNKWSISGTTQTFTKEDDATTAWTTTLTATAGADPVTGSDPA